jgi:hypothetical protein
MRSERILRIVMRVVGLLFLATVYPLTMALRDEPALAMMLSLYVTLGVFLLLASREPEAHRSLIAFTAWSSLAHAAVMTAQERLHAIRRGELIGVAVLALIGVTLVVLAPGKPSAEQMTGARANT